MDTRTPAEIAYDATRLSRAPIEPEQRSPLFSELKAWIDAHFAEQPSKLAAKDLTIGTIDGCPVTACYDGDDGELYHAEITWCGLTLSTDGTTYVNLADSEDVGCVGDISFASWCILSAATKAGIVDELIALALAHQWLPNA